MSRLVRRGARVGRTGINRAYGFGGRLVSATTAVIHVAARERRRRVKVPSERTKKTLRTSVRRVLFGRGNKREFELVSRPRRIDHVRLVINHVRISSRPRECTRVRTDGGEIINRSTKKKEKKHDIIENRIKVIELSSCCQSIMNIIHC